MEAGASLPDTYKYQDRRLRHLFSTRILHFQSRKALAPRINSAYLESGKRIFLDPPLSFAVRAEKSQPPQKQQE